MRDRSSQSGPIVVCTRCGEKHREGNDGHLDSPRCIVARTAREMAARGWARCGAFGRIIEQAGFVVEKHPVSTYSGAGSGNRKLLRPDEHKHRRGEPEVDPMAWGVIRGPWAEARVVATCTLLDGISMKPRRRAEMVRRMLARPELRDAVEAARVLSGARGVLALMVAELVEPAPKEEPVLAERDVRARGAKG